MTSDAGGIPALFFCICVGLDYMQDMGIEPTKGFLTAYSWKPVLLHRNSGSLALYGWAKG
ncbi:hypothetical protein [Sphingobium lignivorans]|uniref:hypothetical protein n=1 Tax=Sphingobium lignivorans TaxID=2735886 RepID=UPI001607EDE4|nr:hypothetical protein [Sphingobium lignivorans]